MISMPKVQDLRKMARGGYSVAEISRETGVSEPAVRKCIKKADFSPKVPVRKTAPSKLDPYKPTVDSWLISALALSACRQFYRVEGWPKRMGDYPAAESIVDRLKNNACTLELKGEVSMRERCMDEELRAYAEQKKD